MCTQLNNRAHTHTTFASHRLLQLIATKYRICARKREAGIKTLHKIRCVQWHIFCGLSHGKPPSLCNTTNKKRTIPFQSINGCKMQTLQQQPPFQQHNVRPNYLRALENSAGNSMSELFCLHFICWMWVICGAWIEPRTQNRTESQLSNKNIENLPAYNECLTNQSN